MTRKLVASLFALGLVMTASAALAGAPATAPAETAPAVALEPLPWLEMSTAAGGFCEGVCNGSAEIIFYCDNLNPQKCCQLLEESGSCPYGFIGYCSGAWDARCRF